MSDLLYIFGGLYIPFLFVHVATEQAFLSGQLLFCFILLPFVHLLAPKKSKTCDIKQRLFIKNFLLKLPFSLLSIIFKQLLFCFILLPFVHLPVPKKNKTCNINQKLFIQIFLLKFLFSLLSIFLSYLSLLLNSNKASKIIFKTMFDVRKEHIALHITIFEFESNRMLRHSNISKQNIQIVLYKVMQC